VTSDSDTAAVKARQRAMWSAGDYDSIATFFWDVGAIAVEAAAIEPAMAVLDVACGTGNAAVRAAQAGADVTGLDLTPELFEAARRRAAEAGVTVEWVEGDAEALPFDDASFDRVLSTFGGCSRRASSSRRPSWRASAAPAAASSWRAGRPTASSAA
jgi:2-polyprenyl-3-methyl-5-hydroxy-6-metoxy-1,4-benzoquinol methylase